VVKKPISTRKKIGQEGCFKGNFLFFGGKEKKAGKHKDHKRTRKETGT